MWSRFAINNVLFLEICPAGDELCDFAQKLEEPDFSFFVILDVGRHGRFLEKKTLAVS